MMDDQTLVEINEGAAELCRRDFFFFIQEFWDIACAEEPVYNWHIEYLAKEAQRIIEHLKARLDKESDYIINVPPGSSKSTIWTIMLPAYAWIVDPSFRILTISYSDGLATEHSLKSRDIITSDRYRAYFPYVELKKDQNNKTNYKTTQQGQRMAAGLNGTITGTHAHLILIDDPLNPKQAASEVECLAASRSIDSTLSTRKVAKAMTVTVLIMQRLSENDPTQHLLDKVEHGKKVNHICLPAELKDGPIPVSAGQYYSDGLLDPVRLSPAVLAEARIDLGAAGYAGQFSQRPAPAKGLIWQRWFRVVPDHAWPDTRFMTQFGTDWDLAYTKDDENAASAYITAGKIKNDIFIDALGFDWLEFPQLIAWMKTRTSPHYIEAKASGKSAKQVLLDKGVIAIEVQVPGGGDKVARARMATPIAEAGFVYIRQSIAEILYSDGKQGILNFPKGKYKDLADTLSQCLLRLGKRGNVKSTSAVRNDRDEPEY